MVETLVGLGIAGGSVELFDGCDWTCTSALVGLGTKTRGTEPAPSGGICPWWAGVVLHMGKGTLGFKNQGDWTHPAEIERNAQGEENPWLLTLAGLVPVPSNEGMPLWAAAIMHEGKRTLGFEL